MIYNCIQFAQNYGERPPDYDQSFISQKLKYRVKTQSRHNIRVNRLLQVFSFLQVCSQF